MTNLGKKGNYAIVLEEIQSSDLMTLAGKMVQYLEKLGHTIPMIGLAKREEIIVIPKRIDGVIHFTEINIDNKIPGINLLRRIRDEAHRFAITYHKLLRKKRMGI